MSVRALVTIDGLDGSGKSELAARLAAALGPRAAVLGVDEFRRDVSWTRRPELDVYYEERYDLAALDACLRAFLDGADDHTLPAYDAAREVVDGQVTRSFAGVDHLIVEGVFLARVPAAACALSVWVDVDEAEARRRILARDMSRGRTRKEVEHRIEERYLPAHRRYLDEHAPRERAAIVLDNTSRLRLVRVDVDGDPPAWTALRRLLEA